MSKSKKVKTERRIYCRFCGAKLNRDKIGSLCPTRNCQWQHGIPKDEEYITRPDAKENSK